MKRGPLSNEQKAYIEKNYKKKTVDFFIKKFNKSEAIISKYIDELSAPVIEKEPEVIEQEQKIINTMDLFARKKDRGVVVMTESASSAAELNNNVRGNGGVMSMRNCIHKIRKDQ